MKRYIRTEDGKIYDTNRYAYVWTTPKYIGLGIFLNKSILIPKSSLVKKPTDNLDELCDEFVIDLPKFAGVPYVVTIGADDAPSLFLEAKYQYEAYMAHKEEAGEVHCYGSIWVDGNLMKVAELNEGGGLELL